MVLVWHHRGPLGHWGYSGFVSEWSGEVWGCFEQRCDMIWVVVSKITLGSARRGFWWGKSRSRNGGKRWWWLRPDTEKWADSRYLLHGFLHLLRSHAACSPFYTRFFMICLPCVPQGPQGFAPGTASYFLQSATKWVLHYSPSSSKSRLFSQLPVLISIPLCHNCPLSDLFPLPPVDCEHTEGRNSAVHHSWPPTFLNPCLAHKRHPVNVVSCVKMFINWVWIWVSNSPRNSPPAGSPCVGTYRDKSSCGTSL